MNVLELIREDHRRVRELVRRLRQGTESPEASRRLFGGLRNILERHMEAEEACFYAVVNADEDDLINEAVAEHDGVHEILADLDRASPDTDDWRTGLEDLDEMIETHVEMEEAEIFALARRRFDPERLEAMGSEFKERITPRPRHEDTPDQQRDRMDPYVRE